MHLFINTLIILIAFLGFIAGIILAFKTKEEFKSGKKYFLISEFIILLILALIFLFKSSLSYSSLILFVAGVLTTILVKRIYFYFGLALFLSFLFSKDFNLLIASLIFIYGLSEGTLKTNALSYNKNKLKNLIILNLILFLLPFSLFLINNIINYMNIFSAFVSAVFFTLLFNRKIFISNIYK